MSEPIREYADGLPELGTKAAAVAAIESLIFRAIGAKDLAPLQLRYWLDAYYQARRAQENDGVLTTLSEDFTRQSVKETDCRGAGAPRNDSEEEKGADVSAPP